MTLRPAVRAKKKEGWTCVYHAEQWPTQQARSIALPTVPTRVRNGQPATCGTRRNPGNLPLPVLDLTAE